jgi:hypothetical protein
MDSGVVIDVQEESRTFVKMFSHRSIAQWMSEEEQNRALGMWSKNGTTTDEAHRATIYGNGRNRARNNM